MADKKKFEKQFEKADKLDNVDPAIAKMIVDSGTSEDKISVSKASIDPKSLKPSQTTMVLSKAIQMAIGMLKSGKVGGDLGALISADNHILDGHHRWAATILAGGSKVGGYKASAKGPELLRVLNIVSKGKFGVRNGNPGKGNISDFSPKKAKTLIEEYVAKGIQGSFPVPADTVKKVLEDKWGSVEKGIKEMSDNVKKVSKSVPSWAPDRKQMPVIDPQQVPAAAKALNNAEVDWKAPYKQGSLRAAVTKLASDHPSLRKHLVPLLKSR